MRLQELTTNLDDYCKKSGEKKDVSPIKDGRKPREEYGIDYLYHLNYMSECYTFGKCDWKPNCDL